MNNRFFPLLFTTAISCLSFGCSQTSTTVPNQSAEVHQSSKNIEHMQSANLTWLQYADPKADANLAIEKQDFALLAFAGRVTSFPGINSDSSTIQQCGYRLLANSGDAISSPNELNFRKQLFQYANAYNQLISAACRKNNVNKNN